jgi:signal transduction histidine kinase
VLVGLQRLSYAVPSLATLGSPAYRSATLNGALLALMLGWNVWLFWHARRRGWFPPGLVWLDVAIAVGLLIVVPLNLPGEFLDAAPNWSTRMSQASAALAGAAIGGLVLTSSAVGAILAAHALVTVAHHVGPGSLATELVSCVNGILWFAIIIGFGVRYLRSRGRLLDETNAKRVAAEAQLAADRARHAIRMAHHRALHDTVLTTLTAIARGADHRAEQIRRRCVRDADYVRRLLMHDEAPNDADLAEKLRNVVDTVELLGLRVNLRHDSLPRAVPADVVQALGNATREALNNTFKHAGVGEAWVTATIDSGRLKITVVDRGCGFDLDRADDGFGLKHSIVEPVQAVGGQAHIQAAPGTGTVVELTWRR